MISGAFRLILWWQVTFVRMTHNKSVQYNPSGLGSRTYRWHSLEVVLPAHWTETDRHLTLLAGIFSDGSCKMFWDLSLHHGNCQVSDHSVALQTERWRWKVEMWLGVWDIFVRMVMGKCRVGLFVPKKYPTICWCENDFSISWPLLCTYFVSWHHKTSRIVAYHSLSV